MVAPKIDPPPTKPPTFAAEPETKENEEPTAAP